MKKFIAAINMTFDGYCDRTVGVVSDETHQHYNDLLNDADTMLFGRTTYQLMESQWPNLVNEPSGKSVHDTFALLIDDIEKIVYSKSLNGVAWKNTELKNELKKDDLLKLKKQEGKNVLVSSPSLIVQCTKLGLIDEYQLCISPIIAGKGLPLFKNIEDIVELNYQHTKTFECGVVALYYAARNS